MSGNTQRIAPSQTINIKYNALDSNATRFINPNSFTTHESLVKYNARTAQFEQSTFIEQVLEDNLANYTDAQIPYGNGTGRLQQTSNLVWDNTNARLGINQETPAYALDIIGDAAKDTGTAWINTSDRRTKKNITPFTKGLKEVQQIDPVYFQYNGLANTPSDNKTHVGLIANDIINTIPECIRTSKRKLMPDMEEMDIYSYDASAMDFMLINAIKELKTIIDIQQQEINDLKSKN